MRPVWSWHIVHQPATADLMTCNGTTYLSLINASVHSANRLESWRKIPCDPGWIAGF